MQYNPLVAIYVPTYNSAKTIQKTIQSLLNQTYKNLIIKVYDNCSDDNTLDIINKFQSEKIIINTANKTASAEENYNNCIKDFSSNYACIYHSDDIYHPNIVKKQIDFFQNKNILATLTDGYIINSKDKVIGKILSSKKVNNRKTINQIDLFKYIIKHSNFLITPSAMFDVVKLKKYKINHFNNENYGDSADLDMWLRLAYFEDGIGILPEKLINYRHSSNQLSYAHRNSIKKSSFFSVIDHYLKKDHIVNFLNNKNLKDLKVLQIRDDISIIKNLILLNKIDQASEKLNKLNFKNLIILLNNFKGVKGLFIFFFVFLYLKIRSIKNLIRVNKNL